jgi:hypothetical protein
MFMRSLLLDMWNNVASPKFSTLGSCVVTCFIQLLQVHAINFLVYVFVFDFLP